MYNVFIYHAKICKQDLTS